MLVIIVGGIPIAMPTVLNVTLALGAFKLAKEGAIVARMSAVEEMAGTLLLTDSCHDDIKALCRTFIYHGAIAMRRTACSRCLYS